MEILLLMNGLPNTTSDLWELRGRAVSYFSVLGQSFLIDCDAIGVDREHLKDN